VWAKVFGVGWGDVGVAVNSKAPHCASVHLPQTSTLVHSGPQLASDNESPVTSRPPRCITFVLPAKDKGATSSGVDSTGLSVSPPLEGLVNYRDWMQAAVRLERLHIKQSVTARW